MEKLNKTKLFSAGIALFAIALAAILVSGCMGIGGTPDYKKNPELLVPATADTYAVIDMEKTGSDETFMNLMTRLIPTFKTEFDYYAKKTGQFPTAKKAVIFLNAQSLADGIVRMGAEISSEYAGKDPSAVSASMEDDYQKTITRVLKVYQDSNLGFIYVYDGNMKQYMGKNYTEFISKSLPASYAKMMTFGNTEEKSYGGISYYKIIMKFNMENPYNQTRKVDFQFSYYMGALGDNLVIGAFSDQGIKDIIDVYNGKARPLGDAGLDQVKAKLKTDSWGYLVGKVPVIDLGTSTSKSKSGSQSPLSNITHYGISFDKTEADGLRLDMAFKFAADANAERAAKTIQSGLVLYSEGVRMPADSQYMKGILDRIEVKSEGSVMWMKSTVTPGDLAQVSTQLEKAFQEFDKLEFCSVSPTASEMMLGSSYLSCKGVSANSENGAVKLDIALQYRKLVPLLALGNEETGNNDAGNGTAYLLGYGCRTLYVYNMGTQSADQSSEYIDTVFPEPIPIPENGDADTSAQNPQAICKYSYGDAVNQKAGERFIGVVYVKYCVDSPDCAPENAKYASGFVNIKISPSRPEQVQALPSLLEGLMTPTDVYGGSTASGSASSKATGFLSIRATGWRIDPAGVFYLNLKNNAGGEVNITKIEATLGTQTITSSPATVLANDVQSKILPIGTFSNPPATGDPYSVAVKITYTDTGTGLDYMNVGTVTGKVS
ncbi:Uncharacterised protein [Candidatus Gugararchaeum adminiculabundum]|nr:Uncharacterised protein [Candidatus Gugararchaeum adminiculabundum]